MSNPASYDYEALNNPYNDYLERTSSLPLSEDAGAISSQSAYDEAQAGAIGGQSFDNMWITSWIKSKNYKPKKTGFMIDGITGRIECMDLYASGSIIGSSLHIPDTTTDESFHTNSLGNSWWGANVADFNTLHSNAPAYILNTGAAVFTSVTIHGRDGQVLSDAINSFGNFIDDNLNTSTKEILKDFTFKATDYAGALKTGTIAWSSSTGDYSSGTGIVINDKGIIGADGTNVTFSIGTDGSATFRGDIAASTVTGSTVTGGVVQTSASITTERALMYNDKFEVRDTANNITGYLRGEKDAFGGVGRSELSATYIYMDAFYGSGYLSFYYANGTGGGFKFDNQSDVDEIEFLGGGIPVAGEFGIGSIVGGYNSLTDNAGELYYAGSPVGGSGTVTSVATSGAITGGTFTTSGTISHRTGSSYEHLPSSGTTYQMLRASGSGDGAWTSNIYVGGSSSYYFTQANSDMVVGGSSVDLVPASSTGNQFLGSTTYSWGRLYLYGSSAESSVLGAIWYYSSGGTKQFRGKPATSWVGSFDMTYQHA